jgi:hypothetical protein
MKHLFLPGLLAIATLIFSACKDKPQSPTTANKQLANCDSLCNYTTIYENDDYIVLKKREKQMDTTYGSEIDESLAYEEIHAYRAAYPKPNTQYMDLTFNNIGRYIEKCEAIKQANSKLDQDSFTLRIYPALQKDSNSTNSKVTYIFSLGYKGYGLWDNGARTRFGVSQKVNAFNTGSLCPENCRE